MILLFDSLLILAVLWLAWRSLTSTDLFQTVVLFIAFSLLIALIWARLNAPDIAMAEAGIGSGLTGALFLATLGRLRRDVKNPSDDSVNPVIVISHRTGKALSIGIPLLLTSLAVLTIWALCNIPMDGSGLLNQVQEKLQKSGVTNPVTAVLLNFRAYDTLLEVAVLLAAVIAVWSLTKAEESDKRVLPVRMVQSALVHLLTPVMLMMAGYCLWIGTTAPGGAFQAGAILGGAGVLLVLSNAVPAVLCNDNWQTRGVLVAGIGSFILVALGVMLPGRYLLQYPEQWAGRLILLIEIVATVSIAATLTFLFIGGRPTCPETTATKLKNKTEL